MDAKDEAAALDLALRRIEDASTGTAPIDALMVAVVLIGRRMQPRLDTQTEETVPGRARRMTARRIAAGLRPEDARLGDFYQAGSGPLIPRIDPPRPVVRDRIAGTAQDAATLTAAEREIWRRDREELAAALGQIEEVRAKLTATLNQWPAGRVPTSLPDLVDRAVNHIEVLRSEHQRERSAVDELRQQVEAERSARGAMEAWARDLERQNAALHEQLRQNEADAEAAKGGLPVRLEDMPPGSPARRFVIANRLLIAERDKERANWATLRDQISGIWALIRDKRGDGEPFFSEPDIVDVQDAVEILRWRRQQAEAQSELLAAARRTRDEAAAALASRLDMDDRQPLHVVVDRACRRIETLLGEHQSERTEVDRLRAVSSDLASQLDDARREKTRLQAVVLGAESALRGVLDIQDSARGLPDLVSIVVGRVSSLSCATRVADANRVSLRMDLDEANARWTRIQPLIRALHAWEHSESASASEDVLDEFERWQKAEARALDDDDDEPVDVPQQPDDPAAGTSAATEERRRIVSFLRRVPAADVMDSETYGAILDLADDIEHGAHTVDETNAYGPTPPMRPRDPIGCHPGSKCSRWPECESCGPARL